MTNKPLKLCSLAAVALAVNTAVATEAEGLLTVNLSDPKDYAGGNFEIRSQTGQEFKLNQFRLRGTVIVFPSFLKHRVTEVTRGKRYSLVQWLNGPDFV